MSGPVKFLVAAGVSDYRTGPELHLEGPVAFDLPHVHETLTQRHGFSCVQLPDQAATHDGILKALCAATLMADGGMLVFYWSGHGTTYIDRWGTFPRARQAIVPWDYDPTLDDVAHHFNLLSGAELRAALESVEGAAPLVTVAILDSCHSGGAVKVLLSHGKGKAVPSPNGLDPAAVPRHLGLALEAGRCRVLTMAACRSDQVASDTNLGGAYTRALIAAIDTTDPANTYSGLTREAHAWLQRQGYQQEPRLDGPAERYGDLAFVLKNATPLAP